MPRPFLDGFELQQVQRLVVDGDRVLVEHGVPALEGDFLQQLGRRAARIDLTGVLSGPESSQSLKTLREKFRKAEPVDFVADISTATQVGQVLIEQMNTRELAGKTERFQYAFRLREFRLPPAVAEESPPQITPPPPPDDDIDEGVGTLVVEVNVEGQAGFDFDRVTLTAEGRQEDGAALSRTLTNREGNVWTEENWPAGQFTINAVATASAASTGSVNATVRPGAITRVSLLMRSGAVIATTFVVHFRFDKAFLEPCMREVLKQVEARAQANQGEKLLLVGHTDKAGPPEYNQSLSERRARSVFAYLTFGLDDTFKAAALTDWNALRERRPAGELPSLRDTWGVRQYQHMLQDLGFYPGAVDGDHGLHTNEAVRAFRCQKGLPPGTTVDDDVWSALIHDYLAQDSLAVPTSRFFPNCNREFLKWLGCGEDDPLDRRGTAFRPSRRVELMFVRADSLPCQVPKPVTFKKPSEGAVNSDWCVGSDTPGSRCCFVNPHLKPAGNKPQPCPNDPQGPWCRQPTEPGTITVQGSIQREVRLPNGTIRLDPVPRQQFVLIAPNGEFKAGESSRGEPEPARTDSKGEFSFANLSVGVYTLEVRAKRRRDSVLVRLKEDGYETAKGNAVCKHLAPNPSRPNRPVRLDVVIVNAPVLREIRLPVVAHLMRILQHDNREIRTCPALGGRRRQETSFFGRPDAVRSLFDEVNGVWRQARVRFDLVDVVREVYAHPTLDECGVDEDEFTFLLKNCSYPNAVNVFFFGVLEGGTEPGFGVSVEEGLPLGVSGVGVGDRALGLALNESQQTQALAHEFGHFLNLQDVEGGPANQHRLMLPATTGLNRELVDTRQEPEVSRARVSRGARLDCRPFTLEVTIVSPGAGPPVSKLTRVGGSLSNHFLVHGNPFDTVRVEAKISADLLAVGRITMEPPGPGDIERLIPANRGVQVVRATYTPDGPGDPFTTEVTIRVVEFILEVRGAEQRVRNIFLTTPHPTAAVTIEAKVKPLLLPPPGCIPVSLVTWTGGDENDDPLRRNVPRRRVASTTVKARVGDREITRIIEVRDVVLTEDRIPFENLIERVQIEGLVNAQLRIRNRRLSQADLFAVQTDSFFRARADLPGVAGATTRAFLVSRDTGGADLDRTPLTLRRLGGDRFVSDPILCVAAGLPRQDLNRLTLADFNLIRAQAGGTLRAQRAAVTANPVEFFEVPTRGRVIHVFAQAFIGSGVSANTIRRHIERADRIWVQAGFEVRERAINAAVQDPGGLLDLDAGGQNLTDEELRLLRRHPDCPANPARCTNLSGVDTDFNVFYVQDIQNTSAAGIAYPGRPVVIALQGSTIANQPPGADNILAHEIGHQLLTGWPCQDQPPEDREHKDPACKLWPTSNVMFRKVSLGGDVDRTQVESVVTFPFIVFEP